MFTPEPPQFRVPGPPSRPRAAHLAPVPLSGGRGGQAGHPAQNPFLSGLVSHWRLEDETDAHENQRTLTNNGTTTFNTGKIGNAAYFNGTDQFLSRADDDGLSMSGQTSFTITAWLYLTDNSVDRGAVFKGDWNNTAQNDYGIFYTQSSDRMQFRIADGVAFSTVTAATFGAPPIDTWFFVAAWYDRATGTATDTLNIQIDNGTADSTASSSNGSRDGTRQLEIGRAFGSISSTFWAGRIDSVTIWKRVLTAAERTALYNGGVGKDYPFLP